MLSAFAARPIIELKQRDKSKIETILAHGDRVLVGLNTGSLRIYRLSNQNLPAPNGKGSSNGPSPSALPAGTPPTSADHPASKPAPATAAKPTELLREVDKFSTKAIDQLAIIKEANIIVSLSGSLVSLHDLSTYELIETLARTKSATCFAVTSNIIKDAATGIPEIISRLAVAVKRKLLLWSWHESELSDDLIEIVLPEAVRSVTWATATKIVCGMNAGYVLVDVETSAVTEINGSGAAAGGQGSRFGAASMGYMGLGSYMPKPLATRLGEGQLLLAKDINSLFVDADGKPIETRQIPWQNAPDNIGYNYPYILALQPPAKGSLEVWNPKTLNLLQNISLPNAAQMHFPPPTVSLAHAAKGFHISSDRAVWKMDATDYDSQVAELIEEKKYDEAISVLGMLEDALLKDKAGTLREVKMRKAEMLFGAKRYRESMDLFNEDEVHAPPERVLRLFPRTISGDLPGVAGEEEDEQEQEQESSTPSSDQEQQDEDQADEDDKASGDASGGEDAAAQAASPAKGGAFSRYWLLGGAGKKDSDATSITSKQGPDKDSDDGSIKPRRRARTKAPTLEGKDLMEAVAELKFFLSGTRARLQRVLDPETGKLKRQTSNMSGMTSSSDNPPVTAHFDTSFLVDTSKLDSEEQLEASVRDIFTLVDTALFRVYMLSQPNLAAHLFRIPNFCDPNVVNEKLLQSHRYSELVEFFHGKKLHREALTLLRRFGIADEDGHGEKKRSISEWLRPKLSGDGTGDADHKDPEKLEEKMAEQQDTNGSADEIPIDPKDIPPQLRGTRRTVLYLQSLPPDLIDLILEFADWVLRRDPQAGMEVFLADSENAETLPRDRVLRYLRDIDEALEIKYLEHVIDELGDATPEFHNRVVELRIKALKEMAEDDPNRGEMMEKLVRFLRESRQYSLSSAHRLIPRDEPAFYEASAVVLSNMGNHKQALEIYVFKMKDYARAQEYCNRTHKLQTDPLSRSPTTSRFGGASRPTSSNNQPQDHDLVDPDDSDEHPSIYHTLLSLYLRPTPPNEPNLAPALDLLSKHGSRLPATSTLSLIPDDLPIKDLESYFGARIRAANSKLAESRIMEGLRRTLLVDTQALLLLGDGVPSGQGGRNRRVVVAEERVCGVCHKRLGNSVIAVLPDNGVVHYGCMGRAGKGAGRSASISSSGGGRMAAGAWGRSS